MRQASPSDKTKIEPQVGALFSGKLCYNQNVQHAYEIFLGGGTISAELWREFLRALRSHLGHWASWKISLVLDNHTVHYYLETSQLIPASLNLTNFLLKPTQLAQPDWPRLSQHGIYLNRQSDSFATIYQKVQKRSQRLVRLELEFRAGGKHFQPGAAYLYLQDGECCYCQRLGLFAPEALLAVDFERAQNLSFKKIPKYLKSDKVLKITQPTAEQALFEVDCYPYSNQPQFLAHQAYEFDRHSLVLGSSGAGKSKFLAALIHRIAELNPEQYKIVVIDPHDALKDECVDIAHQSVIDFRTLAGSIDLFKSSAESVTAGNELMLTLFKSLMKEEYNTQMERVLRYSCHLLMTAGQFSFMSLRQLLLDLEYRNGLVKQYEDQLPVSVVRFFLADFTQIKNQDYGTAIAPLLAFIDEMQMVPVFNQTAQLETLESSVREQFLSIFSLSRSHLGNKVVQAIAGLLMQQIFLFVQQAQLKQHLIVIIDEVSVVENPILARFLAELRKYRTSVILAGQYFGQFSEDLRKAIFANTSNYYIFRVSKSDAELLVGDLDLKLAGSKEKADQADLLSKLKARECIVEVSVKGEKYPACKAKTLDFATPAAQKTDLAPKLMPRHSEPLPQEELKPAFQFTLEGSPDFQQVMAANSNSRKVHKKVQEEEC